MRRLTVNFAGRKSKFFLFVLAVLLFGCGGGQQKRAKSPQSVAVTTVKRNTVTRTIELFGMVYGEQQSTVMSKITGRVTEIVAPEGSKVAEGDPILYVLNDLPGMDYKPGPVTSPISGVVGKIYVEVGQAVSPALPVATVASFYPRVKVKAPISERDIPFVKKGTKALVSVSTIDTIFEGKVTNISAIVDLISRSATVEVTVANPERKLIPGMACSVRLVLEEKKDVIAIPLAGLFPDGSSKVVVVTGTHARFREIKVGLQGDELVEVLSGLQEGEKVVTIGKERVVDGEEVKPVEVGQR